MKNTLDDKFCPNGHEWQFVDGSLLYGPYYYCSICDKFWTPTVKEISREEINKDFLSDRAKEMEGYARTLAAKQRVTRKDLIKLGLLEKENQK